MNKFTNEDYLKGIILFGLNAATYKMGLGKTLLEFAKEGKNEVHWGELSEAYLNQYIARLTNNPMPQQNIANRQTKMERFVKELQLGKYNHAQTVKRVADEGFIDVVPRFQTIGTSKSIIGDYFYEIHDKERLVLKDSLLDFTTEQFKTLDEEMEARWGLLEGAFMINQSNFHLANDIRDIYLEEGYERKSLTSNIPFLSGYQGNTCFYCGEPLSGTTHVDHVLPRQVINHDEIWNLVLSHKDCNLLKSDKVVGEHFIIKLIHRNENIMGSNHPWKKKIADALGSTPRKRSASLNKHYDNIKTVLGKNYWGGSENYNPATDPFFRKLITALNN
ncbi:HNH endonuclease [Shewanella halifaxensis]|uniref:HNH endonuclease n=1 Tax=Shewanella halifaxensis TaxID=271098 RepID=UPI000D59879D|nr:HNH endonuclease [Shewanella halifaxensis]